MSSQSFLSVFSSDQIILLQRSSFWTDCLALEKDFLAQKVSKSEVKEKLINWLKQAHEQLLRQEDEGNSEKKSVVQKGNYLFGIPQGAQFLELRAESARLTMELDFPGYSIGGVANGGEPEEMMYAQVLAQTEILEPQKPRHLLGVGTPRDIVQMVARGIDMFDCVYPTRNARHGSLFYEIDENSYTVLHINAAKWTQDQTPINLHSRFPELQTYSKGYLCHLFRAKELLAFRLATLHNLEFYLNLMEKIRQKIQADTFKDWWQDYRPVKL